MTIQILTWLFGPRGCSLRNLKSRRRPAALCELQALEDRTLLSGNVSAQIANGTLNITGDSANNSVEINVSGGNLVVTGLDSTKINGAASFTLATGSATFAGTVNVQLGSGDDSFYVTDGVTLTGTLQLIDGLGVTTLGLRGLTLNGGLSISTGQGNDSLSLEDTTITGSVGISTAGGVDLVSFLTTTINGGVSINTGDGADNVIFDQSHFGGGLTLDAGSENDSILLRQSTVGGNLLVIGRTGDDYINLQDVTVGGRTWIFGLRGDDTIVVNGTNTFSGRAFFGGVLGRHDAVLLSATSTFSRRAVHPGFNSQTVAQSVIDAKVNNSTTGLVPLATQARTNMETVVGGSVTLTTDTSGNSQTTQSNGTLVTRESSFVITGTTGAGNAISVDANGDGQFTDATATAGADGHYSVTVPLAAGAQTVTVKSTSSQNKSATADVNVYLAVGTLTRFTTPQGSFDVELLDSAAPLAVANFVNYFSRYTSSIIHRSTSQTVEGLSVIQGGGFVLDGSELVPVTTDAPVTNEFNAANSNVRGTLAMALPAGNIDGGTSQWFINVGNNASIDSGKYTVFGRVIGTGMTVVDAIHNLTTYNLNPLYPTGSGALGTVPLIGYTKFSQVLTGQVNVTSGSATVTGTGTKFTTELAVGAEIQVGDAVRTVTAISSDTELTVSQAYTVTTVDASPRTNAKPVASQFVLFTSIAKILPV